LEDLILLAQASLLALALALALWHLVTGNGHPTNAI